MNQHLLLQISHGRHSPPELHLASHCNLTAHGPPSQGRDQLRGDRTCPLRATFRRPPRSPFEGYLPCLSPLYSRMIRRRAGAEIPGPLCVANTTTPSRRAASPIAATDVRRPTKMGFAALGRMPQRCGSRGSSKDNCWRSLRRANYPYPLQNDPPVKDGASLAQGWWSDNRACVRTQTIV
jgi:hypothetical protein